MASLIGGAYEAVEGLYCDGTDDYFTTPLPPGLVYGNPVTVIIKSRLINTGVRGLCSLQGVSGIGGAIMVAYYDQTNSRVAACASRGADFGSRSGAIDCSLWHQIGISFANATVRPRIYVDGLDVTVLTGDSWTDWGSNKFEIGSGYGYQAQYMPNCVVEFAYLWNRVLSPAEVQQPYINPYAMFEQRPVWMDYVAAAVGNRRRRLLLTRRAA